MRAKRQQAHLASTFFEQLGTTVGTSVLITIANSDAKFAVKAVSAGERAGSAETEIAAAAALAPEKAIQQLLGNRLTLRSPDSSQAVVFVGPKGSIVGRPKRRVGEARSPSVAEVLEWPTWLPEVDKTE